jgi:hypothetical protein
MIPVVAAGLHGSDLFTIEAVTIEALPMESGIRAGINCVVC